MAELGVRSRPRGVRPPVPAARRSKDASEFAVLMRDAEARGQAAEESFRKSLAQRDPATAAIFGRIADDEAEHLALADRLTGLKNLPR